MVLRENELVSIALINMSVASIIYRCHIISLVTGSVDVGWGESALASEIILHS